MTYAYTASTSLPELIHQSVLIGVWTETFNLIKQHLCLLAQVSGSPRIVHKCFLRSLSLSRIRLRLYNIHDSHSVKNLSVCLLNLAWRHTLFPKLHHPLLYWELGLILPGSICDVTNIMCLVKGLFFSWSGTRASYACGFFCGFCLRL